MQSSPQRKACDVCYRRRIKCDGQKPACSHCVLYHSACTFEASSRKVHDKRQKPNKVAEALQARVKSLEASLNQAVQRIDELERKDDFSAADFAPASAFGLQASHINLQDTQDRSEPLILPPPDEVLSATHKYLATFNSVIPLFNPDRLLRTINGWYTSEDQRDCTTWAAINVVLALAYRQASTEELTPSKNTSKYISNAQSVLADVIMGDTKLLSVQFLVGMALLFQGIQDLKPAAILIAVALRQAHQLGLHTRESSTYLDSALVLERCRVFWIAYILDRDISMRTKQPPIQREIDIDLTWPSAEPEDGAGFVITTDGMSRFNFFLSRVQLAQIQGDIYDAMYSTRARGLSSHQQQHDQAAVLRDRLDDWMSRVPRQFRPDALLRASDTHLYRSFGILFASHLACRIFICQTHIMEARWLQTLQDFGRDAVRGEVIASTPSPPGWQELVNDSREFMSLFTSIKQKDPAFIWMTACIYISAAVCLIANNMFHPHHSNVETDENLAHSSFCFLGDMIQQAPYELLKKTQEACNELLQQARAVRLQ